MNYTNPNAFWLLFLLIVPILIHLFQFRRYKKLKFSNTFFLTIVDREQKSSRKLKHLLILLSRLLLLTFLTISLARPFWSEEQKDDINNLLILDRTSSTFNYTEGSSNRIVEENMNFVNTILEKFPQSSRAVDESGDKINAYQELNIAEAKSGLQINEIIEGNKEANQIILLSDFQQSSLIESSSFLKDSSKQFVFMPPYISQPANIWVDSVWIKQQNVDAEKEELMVKLRLRGSSMEANISLQNGPQLIGTQQTLVDENSTKILNFPLNRYSNESQTEFKIQIEAPDLSFDNTFYFCLPSQEKTQILLLSQESKSHPLIKAVFENQELFRYRQATTQNFTYQNLDEYDLVIIKLKDQLSDFARSAIRTYAGSGKNLVIIPDRGFNQYQFLNDLGFSNVEKIDKPSTISLASPDLNNPFFKNIFSTSNEQINMPEGKPLLQWDQGRKLLTYLDGRSFLSVSGASENIFVFSSPFQADYTNFAKHGIFLPIFYKIAFSGNKENKASYFYLDQPILEIPLEKELDKAVIKLKNADQELVPDQRITARNLKIIMPKENLSQAFYEIIDTNTEEKIGDIALNIPKKESATGYFTAAELEELFQAQAQVKVLTTYDFSVLNQYIEQSKNGFPLWKYFLVLALLSLLAEVLIIRFFK